MTGFCRFEVKPLGPVQLYKAFGIEVAIRFKAAPLQAGPSLEARGGLKEHSKQACFQAEPVHILMQFEEILIIISPGAGFLIESLSASVRRGKSTPCVVEDIST